MALKSLCFITTSILVAAMAAALMMAEAQDVSPLLSLIHIEGTLFCTIDGNMDDNGEATPVFPYASVELQCGGEEVSSAVTSESGSFSIDLDDPVQNLLSSLLSDCSLVSKTPLATCNSNLPSAGELISPLTIVGNNLLGLLLRPTGFQLSLSETQH